MRINFSKSDSDLIKRIQHGDEKAMENIYLKHRGEFVNWSMSKYNVSESDALDHYQDTVTIFFEKVMNGSLSEIESTIKTYLFGIGKNKIRQQFQTNFRKEQHDAELTEHYQFIAEDTKSQEVFNSAFDLSRKILSAIGEPCSSLLKLFYFEKKSMTEIAQKMGHKSEGVSRTTKKRCLEKIRANILKDTEHGR